MHEDIFLYLSPVTARQADSTLLVIVCPLLTEINQKYFFNTKV